MMGIKLESLVSEPIIQIQVVDNVFVRMMCFVQAGDTVTGHAHTFDHITLLSSGAVRMYCENVEKEFIAPHLIVTSKGKHHGFTALQPNTLLCCVHAIRDGDGVEDIAPQELDQRHALELLAKYPVVQEPLSVDRATSTASIMAEEVGMA